MEYSAATIKEQSAAVLTAKGRIAGGIIEEG